MDLLDLTHPYGLVLGIPHPPGHAVIAGFPVKRCQIIPQHRAIPQRSKQTIIMIVVGGYLWG